MVIIKIEFDGLKSLSIFFKIISQLAPELAPENKIISSPERKLSVSDGIRAGVRPFVCVFTLSNIYISETSGLIAIEFNLKHNWGRGKAALGFASDRLRTLVSMTTWL